MLNLSALASVQMAPMPWSWGIVRDFIEDDSMDELIATFPTEGFVVRTGGEGNPYRSAGRRLVHLGKDSPVETPDLAPIWSELALELLSDAYRDAIGDLIGHDLSDHGLQVSIYRNGSQEWLPPHTDNLPKVVTQTIYFHDDWNEDWGGELLLLGSDDINDVQARVMPTRSNSVVHVRTDEAWHAVPPLRVKTERLSMTIVFYDRAEMWQQVYGDSPLGSVLT